MSPSATESISGNSAISNAFVAIATVDVLNGSSPDIKRPTDEGTGIVVSDCMEEGEIALLIEDLIFEMLSIS